MIIFYTLIFICAILIPIYEEKYAQQKVKVKVNNENIDQDIKNNNKINNIIELKQNKNGVFEC